MPIRTRRLTLSRETVSPLTTVEMEAIAAANFESVTWKPSCQNNCVSLDQCPTLPIRECKIYVDGSITTLLDRPV